MAITFPINSEFVALTRNGIPYTAVVGNVTPKSVDIVGTTQYPAIYFVTKDGYAFFRFRVLADPRLGGGFDNYYWCALFDTNNNLPLYSYSWVVCLAGNSNVVRLRENTVRNSPQPGFNDKAEGAPIDFPITNYDIARAVVANSTLGSEQNYFLDFAIEVATLKSYLGITDESQLRFTYCTSANEQNYNKDLLCGDFNVCFSDPVVLGTTLSGRVINKEDGSGIVEATVEIYDDHTLVASTTTHSDGSYCCIVVDPGEYTVKVTKCCFKPNCFCNKITVEGNKNNVYNFSLAYDCICTIKCEIGEIEAEMIEEKQRIYKKITDFFATTTPDSDTLNRYITILCSLDESTAELDCCIAKVLEEIVVCEEE